MKKIETASSRHTAIVTMIARSLPKTERSPKRHEALTRHLR